MHATSAIKQTPGRLRRLWHAIFGGAQAPAEIGKQVHAGDIPTSVIPPVDIAPNDPLLAYLQSSSGVVDIDRMSLDSPALREMIEARVKLVVPLISQGEMIGLISLGPRMSEQEYTADDRRLLENLAGQAAPALQVARMVRQQQAELQERERIEQQLRLARTIQQTLLPKKIPDLPGWSLDAYYQPAWEVGGDFYDFVAFDDGRMGLVIGDVTDKGVPSALVMATSRSLLRASAERIVAPGAVLERVNDLLHDEIPANMFVTCFYAVLDPATGAVQFANAGHDLPYVVRDGVIEEMRATGMPLGLMPGMTYEEKETVIECGEQLLLHSDGLAEAHNPKREMYGFPRVRDAMLSWSTRMSLIDHLLECLHDFTGPEWIQEDDVTLVTIGRDGHASLSVEDLAELARFDVASQPGNERLAVARLEEALGALGISPRQLERIKTAVAEATMNAMEHGNSFRADVPASIAVAASDCRLVVTIRDEGDAPIGDPEVPNLEAKLAGEQSPRGWGLFLIRHMVDELELEASEGRHLTRLVFYLQGDANA